MLPDVVPVPPVVPPAEGASSEKAVDAEQVEPAAIARPVDAARTKRDFEESDFMVSKRVLC